MLKLDFGKRGRPSGSTKRKKKVKELTRNEIFLILKNQLLADLRNKDIDPTTLKQMIRDRGINASERTGSKGSKLWMEILIRRGEFRELQKDLVQATVFGGIACYKFNDGMQFELPSGLSLRKSIMNQELEIFIEDE